MGLSEAMKIGNCNIHGPGSFMSISWDFHKTAVGSVYVKTLMTYFKGDQSPPEAF